MLIPEKVRTELKARFKKKMKRKIVLEVFTQQGINDEFNELAIDFANELAELTDKIDVYTFDLDSKMAKNRDVHRSPTILIDPDVYHIRYTGAPAGEEGTSFLDTIIRVSADNPGLKGKMLKVARSIKEPKNIMIFVTPTCPYCPGAVVEAVKLAIANPKHVWAECVEATENMDLVAKYNIKGVPVININGENVAKSLLPEAVFIKFVVQSDIPFFQERKPMNKEFLKRVQKKVSNKDEEERIQKECSCMEDFLSDREPEIDEKDHRYDIIIIGGGPAGLTAAIYTQRAGMRTLVLESKIAGGLAATNPWVENYPAFQNIPGTALAEMIKDHAATYVPIHESEEVLDIKQGKLFKVETDASWYTSRALILATGADHKKLGIEGEEALVGRGVSYCATCDGFFYAKKRILMVGGGNSAVTEAIYMSNLGCQVILAHRRDELRAEKSLQETLATTKTRILWNTEVREIIGSGQVQAVEIYNNKTEATSVMDVNAVFIAIGEVPNNKLAKMVGASLDEKGFIIVDQHCRTDVKGVYAAGDVTGGVNQIITAAGDGAKAAYSAYMDIMSQ